MKIKAIGKTSNLEDFDLAEDLEIEFSHTVENQYEFTHKNNKYFFELKNCSILNNNSIIIDGFITNNECVGKIVFEFSSDLEKPLDKI